jgi:hypothetical protein
MTDRDRIDIIRLVLLVMVYKYEWSTMERVQMVMSGVQWNEYKYIKILL